jgi:hypothetical protein
MGTRRTRTTLYAVLGGLVVGLVAAAVFSARPARETAEDLQAEGDAVYADYLLVDARLMPDIDSPSAWNAWVDCDQVGAVARELVGKMQTQYGVLALSARLNSALSDGCAFSEPPLDLDSLLRRFDAAFPERRWPLFARVMMGVEDDADGLRRVVVNGRAKAECASRIVRPLRSIQTVPDREGRTHLVRACMDAEPKPA